MNRAFLLGLQKYHLHSPFYNLEVSLTFGIILTNISFTFATFVEQPNVISDYFECENGRLISTDLYCDGADQCEDGSDENDLACLEGKYTSRLFNQL